MIFYQSEYHYQGYAFIILVFLLIALLKTSELKDKAAYKILTTIYIVACTFSHYFSSLFVLFILGLFVCIMFVVYGFNKIYQTTKTYSK